MSSQSPRCSFRPLSLVHAPLAGRGLCSSLLVLLALGAVQAGAATIQVPGPGVGDPKVYCTLGDAIVSFNDATDTGSCVADNSATYGTNDTLELTSDIQIAVSTPDLAVPLVLNGNNHTIDGDNKYRIIATVSGGNLSIKDITLTKGLGKDVGGSNTGGGAIYILNSTVTLDNATLSNNISAEAGFPGGAIANLSGTLTVTNSIFENNRAFTSVGGAIHNTGTLAVSGSAFLSNIADQLGGAISSPGTLTIDTSTFKLNSANGGGADVGQGGAIWLASGNKTITNSTFDQNSTFKGLTGTAQGGAIYSTANPTITNCTFSGNTVTSTTGFSLGGAVYQSGGTLILTYNTFTGNKAQTTSFGTIGGGGIYIEKPGATTTALRLRGNVVSNNLSGDNGNEIQLIGSPTFTVKSYNLLGHSGETAGQALSNYGSLGTGDISATSDSAKATPISSILNTSLLYNGGLTQTHALVVNSPAIDTIPGGTMTAPFNCSNTSTKTQDQRGFYRANGNANDVTNTPYTGYPPGNTTPPQSGYGNTNCDMGAYEFAAKPTKKGAITYTSSRISGPTIIGSGPRYSIEYRIRSTNVSSGSLRNVVYKLNTVCFLNKSTNPYSCLSGTEGYLVDDGGTSHGPGWAVSIPDSTFTGNTFDNGEVFDTTIKLSISGKSGTLRYIVDFYADPAARETLAVSDHQPQFLESVTFDVDLDEPAAVPKRTLAGQESTTSSEISHELSDDLIRAYK